MKLLTNIEIKTDQIKSKQNLINCIHYFCSLSLFFAVRRHAKLGRGGKNECFTEYGNRFNVLDDIKSGVNQGKNGIIAKEVFMKLAEKTLFMLCFDLSKGKESHIAGVFMRLLDHFFDSTNFS